MRPEPREAIKRMRPYSPPTAGRHGKVRLDFNENTIGCSPRVEKFLKKEASRDLIATYPEYVEVKGELARFLQVDPNQLLLTNGTDEAIQLLITTFVDREDEVLILSPSYAMYRFYAEVAGAAVKEVAYRLPDLSFDLNRFLQSIGPKTKAILIANPNNPTGTAIAEQDLATILRAAPQVCVLIDEAYFEFYGKTALSLGSFDNLFVTRTFSKAHGMAGMRIGCLISNTENIAFMHKAQSPYSVNILAARAAAEAIQDQDYVREYVRQTLEGRDLICEAMKALKVPSWPSNANFVLFDAGGLADECLARCCSAGVLIRDRRYEIPGALRVTAGPPEQMAKFISVLEDLW